MKQHPPMSLRSIPPLSAVAGQGDAALGAGRPFLGCHWPGPRRFRGLRMARSAMDN